METKEIKEKLEKVLEHLQEELTILRVGRATPSLVENIQVNYYNTLTPLIQMATINTPETKLILIQPWDKTALKDIEKAIQESSLGINPVVDGEVIRLSIPPMTEERRKELSKIVHEKTEDTKKKIRGVREDVMRDLKNKKNKNDISDDEFYNSQEELQKIIDEYNQNIKHLSEEKEKEVMTI